MSTDDHKLYALTTEDCRLPLSVTPNGVLRHPAKDLPQLYWPDGTICWLANLYLLSGFRKGRSRRNKGGTLATWAKNLSPFIRWCFQNKVDFIDLTDSHFRMFVNVLLMDSDRAPDERRDTPHVNTICSTVLNFLAFVDERYPGLDLIGPTGRIVAEKKSYKIKRNGRTLMQQAWVHESVPPRRAPRRRQPISAAGVDKLYEAIYTIDSSSYVARRRFAMLRLLEITGGRRIEVSFVEVRDLELAEKTGELKVFTAKKGRDDTFRFVPVTKADVKDLLSFVNHYRQRIVRNTIGSHRDHGRLFISETDGEPLETDTLGSELYLLRRAAGIKDEEACMHAFRHRYITNIFRDLIRTHHYQNADDLRRALLSVETLKAKVMEWTGHSSMDSLDRYIHLAFEEESSFSETLNMLQAQRIIKSVQHMLKDYAAQLRGPKVKATTVSALAEMVEAASSELSELIHTSKNQQPVSAEQ